MKLYDDPFLVRESTFSRRSNLIDKPLPIYDARIKSHPTASTASAPGFVDDDNLGTINGPPVNKAFTKERDLLEYIKDAYNNKQLIYCKEPLELDNSNEIANNPVRRLVNINDIGPV